MKEILNTDKELMMKTNTLLRVQAMSLRRALKVPKKILQTYVDQTTNLGQSRSDLVPLGYCVGSVLALLITRGHILLTIVTVIKEQLEFSANTNVASNVGNMDHVSCSRMELSSAIVCGDTMGSNVNTDNQLNLHWGMVSGNLFIYLRQTGVL